MLENPRKTRRNSRLAIFFSLLLSIGSAYCTVDGTSSLFIGGGIIIYVIASAIEASRVATVFLIHHYWKKISFLMKIIGCTFLMAAEFYSASGIWGYFQTAVGQQSDKIAPISYQISAKEEQIKIQEQAINNNNQQIEGIRNSSNAQSKIFEKQLSGDTSNLTQEELTKIQKQQNRAIGNSEYYQTQINRLYNKNRTANDEIIKLRNEIADLKKQAIETAPELQRMKPMAKILGITDDQVLMTFIIILIMCIFDPLSMYLMILGDNIGKMVDDYEVDGIDKNEDIKKSLLEKITLGKFGKKKEEKKEDKKELDNKLSEKASKKLIKKIEKEEKPKANKALKTAMKEYEELLDEKKTKKKIKKTEALDKFEEAIKKHKKKESKKERKKKGVFINRKEEEEIKNVTPIENISPSGSIQESNKESIKEDNKTEDKKPRKKRSTRINKESVKAESEIKLSSNTNFKKLVELVDAHPKVLENKTVKEKLKQKPELSKKLDEHVKKKTYSWLSDKK